MTRIARSVVLAAGSITPAGRARRRMRGTTTRSPLERGAQQSVESAAFSGRQSAQHVSFDGPHCACNGVNGAPAAGGQSHPIGTSIDGIGLPHHHALRLERVDQLHGRGPIHVEQDAEGLLRLRALISQNEQDANLARPNAEWRQRLFGFLANPLCELIQEEPRDVGDGGRNWPAHRPVRARLPAAKVPPRRGS